MKYRTNCYYIHCRMTDRRLVRAGGKEKVIKGEEHMLIPLTSN